MAEIIILGTVKEIKETETFANDFTKKQIVVTELEGEYPQDIPVEFIKDKISKTDGLAIGDKVELKVNFRGSEFNGKNYLSLQAWYLRVTEKASF